MACFSPLRRYTGVLFLLFSGVLFCSLPVLLSAEETKEKAATPSDTPASVPAANKIGPLLKIRSSSRVKKSAAKKSPEAKPEKSPEEKKQEEKPDPARIFRDEISKLTNEIIKAVQEKHRVLSGQLSEKTKREILESVVDSLDYGMEYVSAEQMKKKEDVNTDNEPPPPRNALLIASGKILYLRLDSFSPENVSQMKKDCTNCAASDSAGTGTIIDLRNSHGTDYRSALAALGLFISYNKMDDFNLSSVIRYCIKTPLIILTGDRTKGAPEIFTHMILAMRRGVSFGGATAGDPFRKEKIKLSNGDFLLIPEIYPEIEKIKPEPINPVIAFEPYPQIEYKKLKKSPDSAKDDKCLWRAVEMLSCINALKQ